MKRSDGRSFANRLVRGRWVALALVALVCGGCTSTPDEPTEPTTTTTTTLPAASAPSQDVVDEVDAAFNYYFSEGRRALLQGLLDAEGRQVAQDLLSGRIPAVTRGLRGEELSPVNGWGILSSSPYVAEDESYVEVTVKFTDGEVDLSGGVLALMVKKGSTTCYVIGKYTPLSDNELVAYTPNGYGWGCTSLSPTVSFFYFAARDQEGTPEINTPLDPNTRYEVRSHVIEPPVTIQQIKDWDAKFIAEIRTLM